MDKEIAKFVLALDDRVRRARCELLGTRSWCQSLMGSELADASKRLVIELDRAIVGADRQLERYGTDALADVVRRAEGVIAA